MIGARQTRNSPPVAAVTGDPVTFVQSPDGIFGDLEMKYSYTA